MKKNDQAAINEAMCQLEPTNEQELQLWIQTVLGVRLPVQSRCDGHGSPSDYLCHTFFEKEGDAIVWANRGGGKTYYGAMVTLLDMLFKPGIEVRILGGSLDQSSKMFDYLRWMIDRPGLREMVDGKLARRGFRLTNGSGVELLAQSETSVRGQRVQKLRCDEVELFKRDIWEAAQFVTRSAMCGDKLVKGSVEAMSTMHKPYGLMHDLIEQAKGNDQWKVFQWCALDVMDRCEAWRKCSRCLIQKDCQGEAKSWRGFLSASDVLSQRRRSSAVRFECEMLCKKPSRSDAVFTMFDPEVHVGDFAADHRLKWIGGMDFGMRNPLVMLWAQLRPMGEGKWCVEVIDEYISSGEVMNRHIEMIGLRDWPACEWIGVDPAGNQRNDQTGSTNVGLLRQRGFKVRSKASKILQGIELMQRRLEADEEGEVGLKIHKRCVKLIEAMACYHFNSEKPSDPLPMKDGFDHAVDALRYMLINLERVSTKVHVRYY